ncbi:MAG: ATPase [Chitinophagales bacterium]|nr:ATPase [Chitinophagales bacterium]
MKKKPTKNKKYQMEFAIKSSPIILFPFLSTPSGMSEWFADKVAVHHNQFVFTWDNVSEEAELLEMIEEDVVRFRWKDHDKKEYFEFKITNTEITDDTILLITDFAPEEDLDDEQQLWESQVNELKSRLGGF